MDGKLVGSIWLDLLSRLYSSVERLAALSAMRNTVTGVYSDPTLELQFDSRSIDRAMRATHVLIFNRWLTYSFEQKKADVRSYALAANTCAARDPRDPKLYCEFIPESASNGDRDLFLTDIKRALAILRPWDTAKIAAGAANLTGRQKEILLLIAKGMTTKEIACALSLSANTINNHRKRISEKLDLHSTADVIAYVFRNLTCCP